jgi:hypothetical protein
VCFQDFGRAASAEGHQYSRNRRVEPGGFARASSEDGGRFKSSHLVSESWDDGEDPLQPDDGPAVCAESWCSAGAPTGGPRRKEDSFGLPQNMRGSLDQSVGVESKDPAKPGFGCSSVQVPQPLPVHPLHCVLLLWRGISFAWVWMSFRICLVLVVLQTANREILEGLAIQFLTLKPKA